MSLFVHGDERLVTVVVDDMGEFGVAVIGWENHGRVRHRATVGNTADFVSWALQQSALPEVTVQSGSLLEELLAGSELTLTTVAWSRRVTVTLLGDRAYAEASSRASTSPSWQGPRSDVPGLVRFLRACGGTVSQILLYGEEPAASHVAELLDEWPVKIRPLDHNR